VVARLLSLLASLFVVGSVYRAGNADGFALYVVATSIVALLPFSDLGLGLALVTELPKAGDHEAERSVVSTSFWTLIGLAGGISVLVLVLTPFISWRALLGVGTEASAGRAAVIVLVGVVVGAPMTVASKTLFSLGRASWAFRIDCATALLSAGLAGVGLLTSAPIEYFVFSTIWSPVIMAAIASIVLFGFGWTHLRPRWAYFSRDVLKRQLLLGATLAYAGIAVAISMQSDLLIVSHLLDERAVSSYGLAMRLGVVFTSLITVTVTPLWPEFARMISHHQVDTIRATLRKRTRLVALAAVAFVVFATVLGPTLLRVWSNDPKVAGAALCGAVAVNVAVQAIQLPVSMFVNATGHKRIIVLTATGMCVINLAVSILLTLWIGVEGPAIGTTVAVLVGLTLPLGLYARRELGRMQARTDTTPATVGIA
jgi:O-antigen/teichoic acid export membrane protein